MLFCRVLITDFNTVLVLKDDICSWRIRIVFSDIIAISVSLYICRDQVADLRGPASILCRK